MTNRKVAAVTLAEAYLEGRGGSSYIYRRGLTEGHRLGQAFYNALSLTDQDRLVGTSYNVFHSDDQFDLYRAVGYLLETE